MYKTCPNGFIYTLRYTFSVSINKFDIEDGCYVSREFL